jgi:DNA replication protein DnaC
MIDAQDHRERESFEHYLDFWAAKYRGTLPEGYATRDLATLDQSDEMAALRAYDEENDQFGFILMGPAGVGKTYVLTAMMMKVLRACYRHEVSFGEYVAYFPIGYLLYRLRSTRDAQELETCVSTKFLFLDDLGAENTTDFAREHFFTILDIRCQKKFPTFITTNLSFNELKDKYGERVVSRLKEMCLPLQMKGHDRRVDMMKERMSILKARSRGLTVVKEGQP